MIRELLPEQSLLSKGRCGAKPRNPTIKHVPFGHSYLKATIGSTFVARRAGM